MADKKFIIEVRTKGFAKANRDMGKLDTSSKSYEKTADRMRGSTNGLQGSIGALRNRILVYTFAIGGAVGAMNKFVKAASGFQDVKTRLVGLTGSVEEAEVAFQAFNKVAATTPFALDDVVNAGAQLQAFGVDAKHTLSATTDLAAFMGTTATEAASALGRAFAGGAGAADILRERGILQLIKDSQGITDITKITLPEFRVALLKAMTDPDGRISGSADRLSKTFTGAVRNMQDAVTVFAAMIGDKMIVPLTKTANAVENMFRGLNPKRIAEISSSLGALATAFIILRVQAMLTVATLGSFMKVVQAVGLVLTTLGVDKIMQLMGTYAHLEESVDSATTSVKDQKAELETYLQTIKNSSTAIDNLASRQEKYREDNKKLLTSYEDQVASLESQIAAVEGKSLVDQEQLRLMTTLTTKQKIAVEQIEILTQKYNDLVQAKKDEAQAIKDANRAEEARQKLMDDMEHDTKLKAFNELREMENAIIADNNQLMDDQIARMENAAMASAGLMDNTDKMAEAQKQQITVANQLAGTINIVAGAMSNLGDEEMNTMQKTQEMIKIMGSLMMVLGAGTPVGAIGSVVTAIGSIPTGHTGGLVKNDGIQRFAQGGMVQGQDNVPIMAQAGEFIMRREAVQNIGVQNLAQMNKTGQGGVTVNIQGNMIGNDEFVRDNLLPQIAKAARQNLA